MWKLITLLIFLICIFIICRYISVKYFTQSKYIEHFNDVISRTELYDHPNQCPYEYIKLSDIPRSNNMLMVESKLINHQPNLNLIYNSIDDFSEAWNNMITEYPNLKLCGDPYQKYLDNVRQSYVNMKGDKYVKTTTTPVYVNETFTSSIDINNSLNNIEVYPLNRTIDYTSQITTNQYMSPNVPPPNQIDTSIKPASVPIPITNSAQNIDLLRKQLTNENFEQQREYQKLVVQLQADIISLTKESEELRQQLIREKSRIDENEQLVNTKHQELINANRLTHELSQKLATLTSKYRDMENLYLTADSKKIQMEVRLDNVRTTLEQEIKNGGYTYMPPTHWTMNQWRPPNCLIDKQPTVPSGTTQYPSVFNNGTIDSNNPYTYKDINIETITTP